MADRGETFERVLAPEPGRTALVVVDMQRGFLEPGEAMAVPPAREIVPVIQSLLSVFRARRLPVVFTEFVYSQSVPVLIGSLHPEHKPAPCPRLGRRPVRSVCASAGTTRSPVRPSTARCEPGT